MILDIMSRDWREKYKNVMTGKEIIMYLLHFDLDTEVTFLDDNGYVHSVTDDSRETYLGKGKYDKTPKEIRLRTTGFKRKLDNK